MPVDPPSKVYRDQLTALSHGFALWNPSPPKHIYDNVSIGDVGYLQDGTFIRMFNVMLPWDHPSNRKLGDPEPYEPLDCGQFDNTLRSTFDRVDHCSRYAETNHDNLQASSQEADGVTYRCRGRGAVLSLPNGGYREDVIRTKPFENYIRDHVVSWFNWAQKNKLEVERMEDLILVSGCTLVTSWAAAVFVGATTVAEISLTSSTFGHGGASFVWRNNQGPVVCNNSRFDPQNPPRTDQCVFIKGFKAKRSFFRIIPIRATAKPFPDYPHNHRGDEMPEGRRTTIEMLSEDTLLDIFDFYRLDTMKQSKLHPWKWHRLAHVCRKWRHVISISPRRLHLRILCEYGAPIESMLDSWPTLPLCISYKGPESKSLPNNIIAALRRPDRLCEIDLVLPSSLIGSIVGTIQEPLPTLECIRITAKNATGPPMLVPEAFLGGSAPYLREIKLDGIAFPFLEVRQVLLSTNSLVDLHLVNIPNDVYFSPDDLVTSLSTLLQLKRLTVDFHSPTSSPPQTIAHLPHERTTLPSLTFFDFHGEGEYLEEFVARIDLPALYRITIRLINDIFYEIPHFYQFIPYLNQLRYPTRVLITHSVESVNAVFFQERKPSMEKFLLGTSCQRLDWQLSFVTQISSQLSPLLSSVKSLGIKNGHELPMGETDVDSNQWLELFQPFTHVTQIDVWEKELVPAIVKALVAEDSAAEVLPELTSLHLSGYHSSPSVVKAAEQFVATRGRSGRTVHLTG